MMAIASLLTNAFKTVQPSAKDKADTYRRADAHLAESLFQTRSKIPANAPEIK